MPFIFLTGIITAVVAISAAYFSIYGLALIFAGAFWPVVIMGGALEAGKLSLTSIIYNYWDKLTFLMKWYSIGAVLVLMVITSGGIYGFLSAAYQTDQIPLEQINAKIELLSTEFKRKNDRLVQMDGIIASISANYITKRLEEKRQQEAERKILSDRINAIEAERLTLSTTKIETQAHIGPIIYMARVFNMSTDDITNYLILLLIFVFDPLAVAMTIHVNMLVDLRSKRKKAELEAVEPVVQPIVQDDTTEPQNTVSAPDMSEYDAKMDRIEGAVGKIADSVSNLQKPKPIEVDKKQELIDKIRS
jgi:hypothetical protein